MAARKSKPIDPAALAFRSPEGARAIGVGQRTFEQLLANGEIKSFKIGRCRVVRRKDLEAFLEAQAGA